MHRVLISLCISIPSAEYSSTTGILISHSFSLCPPDVLLAEFRVAATVISSFWSCRLVFPPPQDEIRQVSWLSYLRRSHVPLTIRPHRELEHDLVPEWRAKYLDYKVLFSLISPVAFVSLNRLTVDSAREEKAQSHYTRTSEIHPQSEPYLASTRRNVEFPSRSSFSAFASPRQTSRNHRPRLQCINTAEKPCVDVAVPGPAQRTPTITGPWFSVLGQQRRNIREHCCDAAWSSRLIRRGIPPTARSCH